MRTHVTHCKVYKPLPNPAALRTAPCPPVAMCCQALTAAQSGQLDVALAVTDIKQLESINYMQQVGGQMHKASGGGSGGQGVQPPPTAKPATAYRVLYRTQLPQLRMENAHGYPHSMQTCSSMLCPSMLVITSSMPLHLTSAPEPTTTCSSNRSYSLGSDSDLLGCWLSLIVHLLLVELPLTAALAAHPC